MTTARAVQNARTLINRSPMARNELRRQRRRLMNVSATFREEVDIILCGKLDNEILTVNDRAIVTVLRFEIDRLRP